MHETQIVPVVELAAPHPPEHDLIDADRDWLPGIAIRRHGEEPARRLDV
jgi:hypothetical protein